MVPDDVRPVTLKGWVVEVPFRCLTDPNYSKKVNMGSFAGRIFHPLRHLHTHVQKPFLHFMLNLWSAALYSPSNALHLEQRRNLIIYFDFVCS